MTRDRESGQGLIELAIALAVLLVVTGAAMAMLTASARAERGQQARRVAMEDLRLAMARVTKDVRQATSVSTASTTQRLDIQTLVAGVERNVVFEVVGDELRRQTSGLGSVPILRGVESTDVFCYDPPDCLLASPASANPAMINVSASVLPSVFADDPVALSVDVQLRNS